MADLQELNPSEVEWISGLALGLREQGVGDTAEGLSEFFEEQREAWLSAPGSARCDPNH